LAPKQLPAFEAFTKAVFADGALSTGILRKRFPVAAKIALETAGTIAKAPHLPVLPGGSKF
jgi:hypothetical protein